MRQVPTSLVLQDIRQSHINESYFRTTREDPKRAMFSIRDFVTAGINILGAINALEDALARSGSNTIVITANEKDLICFGIVDVGFVLSVDDREPSKVLSFLALRITSSFEVPRSKATAALAEFRATEALSQAEFRATPVCLAA